MKTIDLSHVIEAGMPVFPGTEPPILLEANTIARDGFAEKKITFYSHTGTHMDAPAHMLPGAKTLDAYAAADFYGRAVVLDVSRFQLETISWEEHLAALETRLKGAHFLILRTGWEKRWGQPDYFENFPALTVEAAQRTAACGLRGVGIDAISIDRMEDNHFPVHHVLFNAGMFVIENLCNLEQVGEEFTLACFPLRIQNADGSPVRAAGIVE